MSDNYTVPAPDDVPAKRGMSVVWLMPLLAIIVALGMVWKNYNDRGPLIQITFPSAAGIEVERTALRYKDVQVGIVEEVTFSDNLESVDVHVRVDKEIAEYIDDEAEFWLVQPKVSARGITGLNTVLSGVYIEGAWNGAKGKPKAHFTALNTEPLAQPGETGTQIVLRSKDGSQLAGGAPILFNGIEVGRIGDPVLSDVGMVVTMEAFIAAPHDKRLTTATRFWDSSGFSLGLGAGGVTVNIDSLAALVEGGISFGTLVSGGEAIQSGHVFEIYGTEKQARESVFQGTAQDDFSVSVLLETDVSGLTPGSAVRYQGVKVGEVTDMTGFVLPNDPNQTVQLLVNMSLIPAKLGIDRAATKTMIVEDLRFRVEGGLRARLASEGLLGQTLIMELVDLPAEKPATLNTNETVFPLIPAAPAVLTDATDTMGGLLDRINNLPIEGVMESVISALDSINRLVSNADTQGIPSSAKGLLDDSRALVASDDVKATLADLQGSVADLRKLVAEIAASTGVASLLTAMEQSGQITSNVTAFTETLPKLSEETEKVITSLQNLPVQDLITSANATVQRVEHLLNAEGIEDVPTALSGALVELRTTLAELRQGGAVTHLNRTLESANSAVKSVDAAAQALPSLTAQFSSLAKELEAIAGAYGERSRFNNDLRSAIRSITATAESFRSLARTIERNPNSLITGR